MTRRSPAGSFWPNERQTLLLRAGLLGGRESADIWQRLRPTFDLDRLDSASTAILPLLYRQLERLGIEDPLLPRLRGVYRRTWYANQLLLDRVSGALTALASLDAKPLVVSSWELPFRYYGDVGLRGVPALELLVRRAEVARAAAVLADRGWGEPVERSRHSLRFANAEQYQMVLRWELFHEYLDRDGAVAPQDLWETALEFSLAGVPARALGTADELLNICLSGAKSGPAPTILWLADAFTVLANANGAVDWDRAIGQAQTLGATLRIRDALSFLRAALGAPVPDVAIAELERTPHRPRERLAHRLAAAGLGPFGPAPEGFTRFLRATAGRPLPTALASLPSFLRDEWGLERRTQVPFRAVQKGATRVARAARASSAAGMRR